MRRRPQGGWRYSANLRVSEPNTSPKLAHNAGKSRPNINNKDSTALDHGHSRCSVSENRRQIALDILVVVEDATTVGRHHLKRVRALAKTSDVVVQDLKPVPIVQVS